MSGLDYLFSKGLDLVFLIILRISRYEYYVNAEYLKCALQDSSMGILNQSQKAFISALMEELRK